jgi:hypothetical protein
VRFTSAEASAPSVARGLEARDRTPLGGCRQLGFVDFIEEVITLVQEATCQQALEELRQLVDVAKHPTTPTQQSRPDLSAILARLGELHQNGVLSDEEFAAAKKRAIEGD